MVRGGPLRQAVLPFTQAVTSSACNISDRCESINVPSQRVAVCASSIDLGWGFGSAGCPIGSMRVVVPAHCRANRLELDLLQARVSRSRTQNQWLVMGALLPCSTVHYAIIQASSKKDHPEKVVITYPDENRLHDLIAAPSIIDLGFASREEAMAKLVGSIPDPRASEQKRRPIPVTYKARRGGDSASRRGLVENYRITYHILQRAFSTIIVLFYSRSLFSVMLRTALGFSS
jgi:hypothetical protein